MSRRMGAGARMGAGGHGLGGYCYAPDGGYYCAAGGGGGAMMMCSAAYAMPAPHV